MAYGYMIVKIILLARLACIDGAIKLREELTIIYNHNKQAKPTNGHEARMQIPCRSIERYSTISKNIDDFFLYLFKISKYFLGFRLCFLADMT